MKKIMFNDKYGLTQAVLNGQKTMTRRLIKDKENLYADIRCMKFSHLNDEGAAVMRSNIGFATLKPAYQIGEVVAVAQSYESMANGGYLDRMTVPADNAVGFEFKLEYCGGGYKNKMFVAADLMPHRIRITDIKVERLQDISGSDIQKEGIWLDEKIDRFMVGKKGFFLAKEAFAHLIDKVSGKGTWERNPWVFAYSFELIK